MDNQKGFLNIELIVSVLCASLIMMAFYQSVDFNRERNAFLSQKRVALQLAVRHLDEEKGRYFDAPYVADNALITSIIPPITDSVRGTQYETTMTYSATEVPTYVASNATTKNQLLKLTVTTRWPVHNPINQVQIPVYVNY